jgi:hypothetical protein
MTFCQSDLFYTSAIRPSTVIVSVLKYQLSLLILYENETAHQKHLFCDSISDLHDEVNPSATELRALGQMAVAWA